MKKSWKILVLICFCMVGIFGCNGNEQGEEKLKYNIQEMTAEEIVAYFQACELSINKVISYDEETDTNGLLGRPNEYTSKVNFSDSRVEQYDEEENPVGGSIEVFNNSEDAKKRYDYVEAVTSSSSLFGQYLYLYENVFLRIDYDLTPSQAKEYEQVFIALQSGVEPSAELKTADEENAKE